jgi:hypothetical protein
MMVVGIVAIRLGSLQVPRVCIAIVASPAGV